VTARARVAAAAGALATLAAAAPAAQAQQPFTRAQGLDPTAAVRVFGMAGSVTVVGWDPRLDPRDRHGGRRLSPQGGGTTHRVHVSTYDGAQDARSPRTSRSGCRAARSCGSRWRRPTSPCGDVVGGVDVYTIDGRIEVSGAPERADGGDDARRRARDRRAGVGAGEVGTGAVRFRGTAARPSRSPP
jgi:hypothetical protein